MLSKIKNRLNKITAWITLLTIMSQPFICLAQTTADDKASVNNQAQVSKTTNDVTQVNIVNPDSNGLSHNIYKDFNIDEKGLILNNSFNNIDTQLAGQIQGNSKLTNGSAKIILNEVTGSNISNLNGTLEVAGQRADVIIANPNGIVGNNFTLINTNRAVLTTGVPNFGGSGSLERFRVTKGEIRIEDDGINAVDTEKIDLIARAVVINEDINAKEINIVTGSNDVKYDDLTTTKVDIAVNKPTVGIDVGELGGMYAHKITMVGTEKGVGVVNAGTIETSEGNLTLTNDGKITLKNNVKAKGNINIAATDDIDNSGKINSGLSTTIIGKNINNSSELNAGELGSADESNLVVKADENITLTGSQSANSNINIEAKNIKNNSTKTSANNDINITTLGGNTENIQGEITANGKIKINTNSLNNSQGTISAKQDSEINTTDIDNTQGIINADSAKLVSSNNINNHQGNIKAGNGLEITAKNISNSYGNINNIFNNDIKLTTQELLNDNGNITSNNNIQTQADKVTNTGLIEAKNDNSIKVKNEFINPGTIKSGNNTTFEEKLTTLTNNGNIISGQNTNIKATTISNSGKVSAKEINIDGETLTNEGEVSATANNNINLTKDLTNTENGIVKSFADVNITNVGKANNNGNINAARDVKITAHEILNDTKGSLTAVNEVDLTTNKFENKGSIDSSQTKFNGVIISKVDSQVIADNSVPGQYKPMIDKAANGVDLVQIASASSAGVSRNIYTNLDVKQSGLILNNSVNYTQTELGGYIDGNARLGGVAAKTILNEVTGSNQSNLRGFVEVAGKRANVIIANPNGFSVNGFGFLNAANSSLVTGKTYFDGAGNINYFDIYNKNISVKGFGANADTSDRLDLLAGSANITAGLWSNEINVITGSNQVEYNTLNAVNVLSGNNPNPAIDISSLGGMYANKIRLSSLDKDATITNNGEITAKKDGFTLSSEGKVENTGEIYVKGNTTATVNDSMTNDGIILTEKETKLYVKDDLKNIDGGVIYSKGNITIAANENLDANNNPTVGSKSVLNQSSTIETDGTLKIKADKITNEKTKFVADWDVTKKNYAFGIRPLPNHYAATRRYNETIQVGDIKEETDQSYLIAGENMLLDGDLDNKYSSIISGNDLDIKSSLINNFGYQNTIITTDVGTDYHNWSVKHHTRAHLHCWTEYGTTYIPYYKQTTVNIDGTRPGVISAKNNLTVVADTINNITFDAGKDKLTQSDKIISTTNASATKTVLDSKLFTKNNEPTAKYLIETNPQYADYKTFMSSDYLMSRIKADPSKVMKRLGDGAYEQQLIRNQILELTGRVFLSTQTSESDQFKTLMDNGIATAKELKLSVGISLTKEQVAQLTSDMVWMEEKNIEGQNVLVPVVYLAKINKEDVKPNGAFINGKNVTVINSSDLNNIGTIRADENLAIKTNNLNNENALLKANNLIVNVQTTVNNFSSTIYGDNVEIAADGDINNITKVNTNKLGALTQTTANKPSQIIANKDIKITGNNITNQGSSIVAGNNVEINANNDMVNQSIETGERVAVAFRHSKATKESVNNSFSTIQAGKNINVATKGNVVIKGANIEAGDTAVINADKNIMISAVKDKNLQDAEVGARGSDYFARNKNYDETVKASNVSAKNNLAITSLDTINVTASNINSDQGAIELNAEKDINITYDKNISINNKELKENNGKYYYKYDSIDEDIYNTDIKAKNNVEIISGREINIVSGNVISDVNDVNIKGKKDINIYGGEELHKKTKEERRSKSGFFSSKTTDTYDQTINNNAVGSYISGNKVNVATDANLKVEGSAVVGTNDVNLIGKENIDIKSAEETIYDKHEKVVKKSGIFSSGGLGFTIGSQKKSDEYTTGVKSQVGSTVGSTDGKVNITSGKDVKIQASDVIATDDINITGQNVAIQNGDNVTNQSEKHEFKQSGLTVSLGGALVQSATSLENHIQRSEEVQDKRLADLHKLQAVRDAQDLSKDLSGNRKEIAQNLNISISLGSQKSESNNQALITEAKTSNINSNKDVNITATKDINVIGSEITGENINLKATDNINLQSAENKIIQTENNSQSGSSIGVVISTKGITPTLSTNKAKENGNGRTTTHTITKITANQTLNAEANNDINLKGVQVSADKIKITAGGNLNLESQQDTDTYKETSRSSGINLSLDKITNTDNKTVNKLNAQGSVSKGKIDSNYQSVTEQTGIYAGKQGFDIKVGKNTDLKGAVIASEADASKNKLSTDTLTYSDIENKAEYSASNKGNTFNTAIKTTAEKTADGKTKIVSKDIIESSPIMSMPVNGNSSSTTKSAIADGTVEIRSNPNQDISNLNRNTQTALNKLDKIFDKVKVQEKQELVDLFGKEAFKLVGDIGVSQYKKALDKANQYKAESEKYSEGSKEYKQNLEAYKNELKNAEKWSESGTYKIILHQVVGGIMSQMSGNGFKAGAVSAGLNEALQKELGKISDPLLHQAVSALVGETAAKITGAATQVGAAVALYGTKYNWLDHEQQMKLLDLLKNAENDQERADILAQYQGLSEFNILQDSRKAEAIDPELLQELDSLSRRYDGFGSYRIGINVDAGLNYNLNKLTNLLDSNINVAGYTNQFIRANYNIVKSNELVNSGAPIIEGSDGKYVREIIVPGVYRDYKVVNQDSVTVDENVQKGFEVIARNNYIVVEGPDGQKYLREKLSNGKYQDTYSPDQGLSLSVIDETATIRNMTEKEEMNQRGSENIKLIPIANTINDVKIAVTGTDLYGMIATPGERINAGQSAALDIGTLGIGSLEGTVAKTAGLGAKAGTELLEGVGKSSLDYITTSGIKLEASGGRTTTVLGTYEADTKNILNELGNVKSTDFGPRNGEFNLLNVPDNVYNTKTPEQFWNDCNKPWLDNAVARNDIIVLATRPTDATLYRIDSETGLKVLTGFGKEFRYLTEECGYTFDKATMRMIPSTK